MNFKYAPDVVKEIDLNYKPDYYRVVSMIPHDVVTEENGVTTITHGYVEEQYSNPLEGLTAEQMSLQCQLDAGIELRPVAPIMPSAIDAVPEMLVRTESMLNNLSHTAINND